jgi:RHS repeat-associated protein
MRVRPLAWIPLRVATFAVLLALVFSPRPVAAQDPCTQIFPPPPPECYGVSVTPKGEVTPTRPPNSGPYSQTFIVTNTGIADTYTIGCQGSGGVTCTGTSESSLDPGSGTAVIAYYSVGAAGTGTLTLTATGSNASDNGWVSVPIQAPPPPPPGVAVTPDGSVSTRLAQHNGYSEVFTVTNTGGGSNTYNLACNGTGGVTCTGVPNPQSVPLAQGAWATVTANYNVGAPGTGRLTVTATGTVGQVVVDSGSFVVPIVLRAVAVRPELSERQHFAATGGSQRVFVKNLQTVDAIYNLTAVCSGAATGCAVAPASVTLTPGESKAATLTYTVGDSGTTGSGMVKAIDAASSSLRDSASVTLRSVAPLFPVVSIVDVNPGTTIERDQCLTIAAGSAAAFECGDLRIVHALPAIRTLNKARVPTLLYNSATADPYPIVAATVTLGGGSPWPDSVEAILRVGGVTKDSGRWAGTDWAPGATRRIALRAAAASDTTAAGDTTKVVNYTLEVATIKLGPGGFRNAAAVNGGVLVVNRRRSSFGAGWGLAGLEQLSFNLWIEIPWQGGWLSYPTALTWVGGDGSARIYGGGPSVWVAPNIDRPDTLTKVGTSYVRRLPGGVTVWFNSAGQHDSTVNRLGHRTTFAYPGGRLASITLPSQGGSQTYTFAYDGAGKLDSVIAPPAVTTPRVTQVSVTSGRLVTLRDPDNTLVFFGYDGAFNRITSRTDRRGTVTSYSYDAAKKLSRVHVNLQPDSIRVGFRALDVQGLLTATPKTATDTANVYTSFFGARQFTHGPDSIGQETKFWLDRFGAPRRIVNPLGHQTLVKREDGEWPALATELVAANGFTTRAGYDRRGNLLRSTAVAPLGPGQGDAITRYHWDSRWDFADSVVTPTLLVTTLAYDTLNGNRLWQQVGSDSARRVRFRYGNTLKLLSSTVLPLTPADSVEYDLLGNVAATRTPRQFWTSFYKDALGRDTLIVSPIDSTDVTKGGSNANRLQARVVYTVADQDTLAQTTAPAKSGAPAQTVTVRQNYDLEGNRLSLTRQGSAPDAGIGPITTQWRYDLAGRQVAEVAPDAQKDSNVYDPAGNVVNAVTRRGPVIMMAYDALNRLTARSLPQVFYPDRIEGIARDSGRSTMNTHYPWLPNSGNGYVILAEQHTFTYDSLGNVRTAHNPSARVGRTYTTSGLLTAETLYVRTVAPIDEGGTFALHKYVLAYRYDLEGRRIGLRYPSQLAPAGSDSVRYAYDTQTGALAQVWDLLGNNFRYHLNARGELDTLYLPNGVVDSRTYDADGNLARHAVSGGRRETTFLYDGRGKQLSHANTYGVHDTLTATYSGMGHLVASHYVSRDVNSLGDSLRIVTSDSMANDALGNRLNEDAKATTTLNGFPHSNNHNGLSGYHANTGRLAYTARPSARDTMRYDAGGNIEFSWQLPGQDASQIEDRASYYAADGTLRAADYRVMENPQAIYGPIKFTFEEYRYDALGRRVWVRARRDCDWVDYKAECRYLAFVRRTVWDGAQELAEIQMPGRDVTPPDTMENDTAAVRRAVGQPEGYEDTNPFWGRVLYTFGMDLDQPLSITRVKYASQPTPSASWAVWDPVSIVPRWNSEGSADGGFFGVGAAPCRTLDGQQRCMKLAWPFAWNASARALYTLDFWHGTLTENKRDKAQTLYRRNRAYDPGTGRFTQEDPIGLAGGLNLYGFANGDPINFSDPFGLAAAGGGCKGLTGLALILCEALILAKDLVDHVKTGTLPEGTTPTRQTPGVTPEPPTAPPDPPTRPGPKPDARPKIKPPSGPGPGTRQIRTPRGWLPGVFLRFPLILPLTPELQCRMINPAGTPCQVA